MGVPLIDGYILHRGRLDVIKKLRYYFFHDQTGSISYA